MYWFIDGAVETKKRGRFPTEAVAVFAIGRSQFKNQTEREGKSSGLRRKRTGTVAKTLRRGLFVLRTKSVAFVAGLKSKGERHLETFNTP
jgi:hypothetical protein